MKEQEIKSLDIKRLIALLALYMAGYLWLVPLAAGELTLLINPEAQTYNLWVTGGLYLLLLAGTVALTWDIWKDSLGKFTGNLKKSLLDLILFTAAAVALNLGGSRLILWISGAEGAQAGGTRITAFALFTAVIFAPVLEETVFRGGIFAFARKRTTFFASAIVSAFFFGAIHYPSSGAALDPAVGFVYFSVYLALGFLFSFAYERNKGICVAVCAQALNNLISLLLN